MNLISEETFNNIGSSIVSTVSLCDPLGLMLFFVFHRWLQGNSIDRIN